MKLRFFIGGLRFVASHPARGAWIEISCAIKACNSIWSHPARGAWIEMPPPRARWINLDKSHPARGAWIEILPKPDPSRRRAVAPREGCVD